MKKHLNLVFPQWQGNGQDLTVYDSTYYFMKNYMGSLDTITIPVTTDLISPVNHGTKGYADILFQHKLVQNKLESIRPDTIFLVGGSSDSDLACAAYLNTLCRKDFAEVFLESHSGLDNPKYTVSELYHGMALRTLCGHGTPELWQTLPSVLNPNQVLLCTTRGVNLSEKRFIDYHHIDHIQSRTLEKDPGIVAELLRQRSFRNVFLHISLDCLDPNEFRLTQYPENSGISISALMGIVSSVSASCNVVGMSITQYTGGPDDRDEEFLKELVRIGSSL
ncbi:arginase family protein [Erysipelotrichaceae bacterium Oil+RF-744-GAM-WT-6]|jgi:arginase|uniref:Arginase family protein n=1 Tax=Stecheria intestinalis TaxID=2606630 RepID=A0A7X2NTQ6_9FIRM|nr:MULTISPECIES: arginase family protein [Erysipelotrichaceae]MCI2154301.1 arginase family protein [Solobacterium sp.]MDY3235069.1 arginase family protein [Erysipelotrichaceae bacterium]MDY4680566.1 arginase family protein [Lachnospiraceae bacterium]MDD5881192.1 arginase family protein [Stecheria intestinalis]MDD6365491.1 arginase family protein [Stecheria intestinalis]